MTAELPDKVIAILSRGEIFVSWNEEDPPTQEVVASWKARYSQCAIYFVDLSGSIVIQATI